MASFPHRLALLAVVLAACGRTEPVAEPDPIAFAEVSRSAGIDYRGPSYGASWGDFNGDDHPDLWVSHHQARPSLYLNGSDGSFRDVIGEVWSGATSDTHGAVWADFDNDGDQDLYETVGGLRNRMTPEQERHFSNRLYVNEDGFLVDRAAEWGVDHPYGRGRQSLWVDWTGDGRLDLVVVNDRAADGRSVMMFERRDESFQRVADDFGRPLSGVSLFAALAELTGDRVPEVVVHGFGFPQAVFAQTGGGLAEITSEIALPSTGLAYDAALADLDGDGRTDLFVARKRPPRSEAVLVTPHRLVAQLHEDAGQEAGISFAATGDITVHLGPPWSLGVTSERVFLGAAGGHPERLELELSPEDERHRGIQPHRPGEDAGVFVGYDAESGRWTLLHSKVDPLVLETVTVVVESASEFSDLREIGFRQPDPLESRLLLADDGRYVDGTDGSGLEGLTDCQSVGLGDFDNDMDLDLYLVCTKRLENLPNRLFANLGGGRFQEVRGAGGAAGSGEGRGDSVAVGDYDNDGFLDLFVTNGGGTEPFNVGPDQLFRNLGNGNHWIQIELEGRRSNRDGLGAWIELTTPDGVRQRRIAGGGLHRLAQDHARLHFGLGANLRVAKLTVRWPSGVVQEEQGLAADRIVRLEEPVQPKESS